MPQRLDCIRCVAFSLYICLGVYLILQYSQKATRKLETNFCDHHRQDNYSPLRKHIETHHLDEFYERTDIFNGRWTPQDCVPRQKIAIIVPYQNNQRTSLNILLFNLHQFLIGQNVEYGIYLVEADSMVNSNKRLLRTVGYLESQKIDHYNCFICKFRSTSVLIVF